MGLTRTRADGEAAAADVLDSGEGFFMSEPNFRIHVDLQTTLYAVPKNMWPFFFTKLLEAFLKSMIHLHLPYFYPLILFGSCDDICWLIKSCYWLTHYGSLDSRNITR